MLDPCRDKNWMFYTHSIATVNLKKIVHVSKTRNTFNVDKNN